MINGALREGVLNRRLGPAGGHIVSTLLLCAAIVAVTYFTIVWIRPVGTRQALLVGLGWLALTLLFEFGFGYARGRTWPEMLFDYNLARGRVWVLVLITTALGPLMMARARGL